MYRTVLLYSTGIAVVAAASLAHGEWTGRWRNADAVARAAANLGRVPRTFGDWAGTDQHQDDAQFSKAGADGFLVRRYENRVTGAALAVMIVCGRPPPVSVRSRAISITAQASNWFVLQGKGLAFSANKSSTFYGALIFRKAFFLRLLYLGSQFTGQGNISAWLDGSLRE